MILLEDDDFRFIWTFAKLRHLGVPKRIVFVGVIHLLLYGFSLTAARIPELLGILEQQGATGRGWADRHLGGTGGSGLRATGWAEPRRTEAAPCDRLSPDALALPRVWERCNATLGQWPF